MGGAPEDKTTGAFEANRRKHVTSKKGEGRQGRGRRRGQMLYSRFLAYIIANPTSIGTAPPRQAPPPPVAAAVPTVVAAKVAG